MSNQTITLNFEKSTTRLAGFPFGESVFNTQVKDLINYNNIITIIFPDHIKKVASSFIQGFFLYLIKNIGYSGFENQINIITSSDELTSYIKKNIY